MASDPQEPRPPWGGWSGETLDEVRLRRRPLEDVLLHPEHKAEVAALRARLAEAERLLRAVEWAGVASWGYELSGCPMCGAEAAESNASHGEGCALARWLEGGASK